MLRVAMQRLRLAFRVAEIDVGKLDAKGWAELKADVGRFLLSAGPKGPGAETGRVWVGSRLPRDVSRSELAELCETTRRILDAMVQGIETPDPPRLGMVLSPVADRRNVVIAVTDASISHRFLFALMLLLAHVGAERVCSCPACGGAFLKIGRRTHCQRPECRRRRASDYWRTYKDTPKGRAARRRLYQHLYDTVYAENNWTPGARSKHKKTTSQRSSVSPRRTARRA